MHFGISNLTNFKTFSAPFERPDFFFLGLPSVGLGGEKNDLVGRARQKRISFLPLAFPEHFELPILGHFGTKIVVITELSQNIKKNANAEVVLKDIQKDLNLPVVIKYMKDRDEFEVVNKTIMRKKTFSTSNKTIEYK